MNKYKKLAAALRACRGSFEQVDAVAAAIESFQKSDEFTSKTSYYQIQLDRLIISEINDLVIGYDVLYHGDGRVFRDATFNYYLLKKIGDAYE